MDIQKLIGDANARSVKLYLYRQQLQMQLQQLQIESAKTDQALIKIDGELEILTKLGKENA
jgi:hypothetical protein